jgi:hypothetical protein
MNSPSYVTDGEGVAKFDTSLDKIVVTYTVASTNYGLLDNAVNAIAVDSAGNKWFGTNFGVSEFTGTSWITYTSFSSGLAGNHISTIAIDKAGNKWFGTNKGVSKFDGSTWTNYLQAKGYFHVTGLTIDNSNNLWVSGWAGTTPSDTCSPTNYQNLAKFDGTTWTPYSFSQDVATTITTAKNGQVWVALASPLIACYSGEDNSGEAAAFDGNSWQFYDGNTNQNIGFGTIAMLGDNAGNMWFGGYGLTKFDGSSWQSYKPLPINNIIGMVLDTTGHKWVAGLGGLAELDDSSAGIDTDLHGLDFNYQTGGNVVPTQSLNLTAYNAPVTWRATISYSNGGNGWLSLDKNSATTSLTSPTPISVSVPNTNLSTGIYTATIFITDNNNSKNQIALNITLRVGYVYYLPTSLVYDSLKGITTHWVIQNNSASSSASLNFEYYSNFGFTFTTKDNNCSLITPLAECAPSNPFLDDTSGWLISLIVTSSQPLNILVIRPTLNTPGLVTTYIPTPAPSSKLIIPLVMNNAFGSFIAQPSIFNAGSGVVTATIKVYDHNGNLIPLQFSSPFLTINPHVTDQIVPFGGLPIGFYGWAEIDGQAGSQLSSVTWETDAKFEAVFNAQTTPATTLYAPTVFNNTFGDYNTGASLVNPNATPVSITITYYDHTGTMLSAAPFNIAAHATAAIYHGGSQGATGANGIPIGGLPVNFYGSAVISSSGGGVIMMVNEAGPSHLNSTGQTINVAASYIATPNGSNSLALPVMANGGYGFTTGSTVLNLSNTSVSATIQYYNTTGSLVASISSFTLAPHGSQALYQGAANLPANFYGTAVVRQTSGVTGSLVATTNAMSSDIFYTYSEPGL